MDSSKIEKELKGILNSLYIHRTAMNNHQVIEILNAIDDYCYACGGGEHTEEEIDLRIEKAYKKLMEVTNQL